MMMNRKYIISFAIFFILFNLASNADSINANLAQPVPNPNVPINPAQSPNNALQTMNNDGKSSQAMEALLNVKIAPKKTKAVEDKKTYRKKLSKTLPEDTIKKFLNTDFKVVVPPKEYYAESFSKDNAHLPPVIFESYYAELAFKAVEKNNLNIVRMFIDQHKFLEKRDLLGNTMLIHAARNNKIDAVRLLLAKNADINAANNEGQTAFHLAIINNNPDIVKALLTMNADPTIEDISGSTALDYISDNSYYEEIRNIVTSYRLNK